MRNCTHLQMPSFRRKPESILTFCAQSKIKMDSGFRLRRHRNDGVCLGSACGGPGMKECVGFRRSGPE